MTAAEIAGLTLLHSLWQGAAIALTMQLLLFIGGRCSAAVRYVIACAALIAMVAVPAITSARLAGGAAPMRAGAVSWRVTPSVDTESTTAVTTSERPGSAIASPDALPRAVLETIAWTWAFGAALLTIRTAAGWRRVRRLHTLALRSTQSRWRGTVETWTDRMRLWRTPRVVESASIDTPAVVGWMHPVVLLPIASLANLTTLQVEAILVHELAHIRRHDYLVNLLQSAVETVLFYHPAVWWVSATVRAEREHCCDDIAVRLCGDRQAYADALVVLESNRFVRRFPVVAATAGPLAVRVLRILQLPVPRSFSRPSLVPAIGLSLALVAGANLLPEAQGAVSGATQATANQFAWSLHATDHVEIYYSPRDAGSVDAVARAAEAAYAQVSTALRHDLAVKVPIVLLTEVELRAAGQTAGFISMSRGASAPDPQLAQRSRMIVPLDLFAQQPQLIAHEMTHQFLFDMRPEPRGAGIPIWLHEGLADYIAGVWTADAIGIVRAGVASRTFMPSGLGGDLRQRADEEVQHLGHAVINFIDHEFGQVGIRRLLAALRSTSPLGDASIFETVFGTSAPDFDREFERFLKEQFGR